MQEKNLKPLECTTDSNTSLQLCDERLEWNVISDLLFRSFEQQQEIWELYRADCFFHQLTQNIYRCIGHLVEQGDKADTSNIALLLMQRNIVSSPADFFEKIESGFSYVSVLELHSHFQILDDYKRRRKLYEVSQLLRREGLQVGEDLDSVIEKVKDKLTDIADNGTTKHTTNMQDVLKQLVNIVGKNQSEATRVKTTCTGFRFIDDKGGFTPTDLIIIAGNTSMGKTSFAISLVQNIISNGEKILFFTFEMANEQLTSRMLSSKTKITSNRLLYARLGQEEVKAFDRAVNDIWAGAQNLYFAGSEAINIDEICASIRKHIAKYGIQGVVIDYLQLVGGIERGESTETFLGRVTRKLKNLAKAQNIWIIVLSQLNRSTNDNYIPSMRNLRGSGQIEEAADVIYLLYRPEYYNVQEGKNLSYPTPFQYVETVGTAMVIQDKGRNNGVGSFVCGFDATTTHYYDFTNGVPTKQVATQSKTTGTVNKQQEIDVPF